MAKKKPAPVNEYLVEINPDDVQVFMPDDAIPAAPVSTESSDQPFELGQWHGISQYRCKLCQFDTLEGEADFWEHYASRHAQRQPETPKPTIFVANRYGNEVT